jgi:phage repressor protein C with HTH and peptisase S24 domain
MSAAERLKEVINYLNVSPNRFATELGYGRSEAIYKVLRGDISEISSALALKVVTRYPEINITWLVSGNENMLLSKNKSVDRQLPYSTNSDRLMLEEKSSKNHSEERIAGNNFFRNFRIPFYDIEVSAGTMNFYQDYPELPHSTIEVPFISDCDLAMPVYGDSMYPKIKNGDVVMLKVIHDPSVIMFGEIYLVVTEDYRTLKYIRKGPDKDTVILVSENDKYDPVVIPRDSIMHLFIYKGKFEKSQI